MIDKDATDRVRKSITDQYRLTRRARLQALEDEIHSMTRRVNELHRRVIDIINEDRQTDETTVRLPILPMKP